MSRQASLDLLATVPTINVAFGVNDHSILAALDAAESMKVDTSKNWSVLRFRSECSQG